MIKSKATYGDLDFDFTDSQIKIMDSAECTK